MKRYLPNRPGRLLALLGAFLAFAVAGWSANSRVWVQYAPGAKGPVMAALAKAGGHVHYEFDNIHAVAVSLPEAAVAGITHNPSVTLVEPDPIRTMVFATPSTATVTWGLSAVQADAVQEAGVTGSGVTVGVVDSGIYKLHNDFSGLSINGESGTPTAYDTDGFGHGTHVSGTIAAQGNNGAVLGVAPGIDGLYMVKVFGDDGVWAYSSTLLHAVQQARSNGARIVSMSLGGTMKSRSEQVGLDALYDKGNGVLLVAAAGNDGNTRTSYPAGYSSVISVAAIDSTMTVADFSQQNSTVELSAPGVGVLSTVPFVETNTIAAGASLFSGNHIEFSGRGTVSAQMANGGLATAIDTSWAGKVVLVQRGTNSFAEKVLNVQNSGGVACVIYNNVSGGFLGTMDPSSASIPAISVSMEDGSTLLGSVGSPVTVTSSIAQPASGYEAWDGTSMATPHVSGVAALIMSAVPGASAGEVRDAMDATAVDLGPAGRDNAYGYGLVQAQAAIDYLEGSPPPPPSDLSITSASATVLTKGKPGRFTVNFTTNIPATAHVTTSPDAGTYDAPAGTSFSHTFQGSKGVTYHITIAVTANGTTVTDTTLTATP